MSRPGGNPGNKGGGRKSAREESLIKDVVNKSWERVNRNLDGERLTEVEKDVIALEVVKRTAPKNITLEGGSENKPLIVKFLNHEQHSGNPSRV